MRRSRAYAERIRRGEPVPPWLDLLLATATPVFRFGMWRRRHQKRVRVNARVISFGNLTTGGTGKTPAVIERAAKEVAAGHKVAVITRGYGTKQSREPRVLQAYANLTVENDKLRHPPKSPVERGPSGMSFWFGIAQEFGDEPALIAYRVPEVTIVKCADRVRAAQVAIEHDCDTLILDDGFQAVRLERDENILVIDASDPFGNGHLLPRGILREPLEAARRATTILLTHCDPKSVISTKTEIEAARKSPFEGGFRGMFFDPALIAQLRQLVGDIPIRKTRHAPTGLWNIASGERLPPDALRGREVAVVCAIGSPEHFRATVESLGATLIRFDAHPDHARIPVETYKPYDFVLTTEKDAMRMGPCGSNFWVLEMSLEDLGGEVLSERGE